MRAVILYHFCAAWSGRASVTVYGTGRVSTATTSGALATYSGAAAYDPTVLNAPPVPNPPPSTSFGIQLTSGGATGLSIKQHGSFMGFSIELSVSDHILGKNGSYLQVPFLNLMANIKQRAGKAVIRVGGNSQEAATLVTDGSLGSGVAIVKNKTGLVSVTETPPLSFSVDLLYAMSNISSLVNVDWFLGIPFADISNPQLQIAEFGQSILGPNLIGLQAANEPDLYGDHGRRSPGYAPGDYFNDFGTVLGALRVNDRVPHKDMLVAPSVCCNWSPEQVFDTGFLTAYGSALTAIAVEHYPTNNCKIGGVIIDAQTIFQDFLNHTSAVSLSTIYTNAATIAQNLGKPFLMFETNTASCGGFAGLSNSFGAALWATDYALQMAYRNFSSALFHIGGQNVYYNPFTPPPTNQSTFRQWTVGPMYYAALVVAEAFGSSGAARIVDLNANGGNIFTPGYAIYENGVPMRLVLFNFVTDPSGASDYTVTVSVGGSDVGQANSTPSSVRVRYLTSASGSVSETQNFFWANQTLGGNFQSDGRLRGAQDTRTVQCDTATNTCQIRVAAPSLALVFLAGDAAAVAPPDALTFATTAATKLANTATVDQAVLATSNGHGGAGVPSYLGSTSRGSSAAAPAMCAGPPLVVLLLVPLGALLVGWR